MLSIIRHSEVQINTTTTMVTVSGLSKCIKLYSKIYALYCMYLHLKKKYTQQDASNENVPS